MSACFAVNVHLISSQIKRVYHCLACFKQIYVFCKDTEAVPSTLFEYIVLNYKFSLWCIITTIVFISKHRNMMWPIYSFWIKSHELNLEMCCFILYTDENQVNNLIWMQWHCRDLLWYHIGLHYFLLLLILSPSLRLQRTHVTLLWLSATI